MFSTTTGQVGLFDAAELVGPPPEGSLFALLAEHGERMVRNEDFADCYSGGPRTAVDSAVAAGQGAAVAVPHRPLRRAGDGGGGVGFALEDRAVVASRPPRLEP
jgi:hypothetical protein